jgi:hypothetical protein
MKGVERSSRESALDRLDPRLRRTLEEYFRERKFGDLPLETLLCVETRTERHGRDALLARLEGNPDTVDYLGIVLTEQLLLWARVGDRSEPVVTHAHLKDIVARPYASRFPKESGLELAGSIGDRRDRVRGKLALGTEPAAQKLVAEVVQAVEKAAPPKKVEIPWLAWLRRSKDKEDRGGL